LCHRIRIVHSYAAAYEKMSTWGYSNIYSGFLEAT
jgi:hypothetical protein